MTPASDEAGSIAARIDAAAGGSVRALARLLSVAESGGHTAAVLAAGLLRRPRAAQIIGLTGPPGVGKSTLTSALIGHYRDAGKRVAVLAVDPSSPFSGGALLGDRIRMAEHATDPRVFIRSLSSRGHLGGLSAGAPAVLDLLSALGFDVVLAETVGVGQNEVDVMRLADTVVLVAAPGMGDEVQAAKAGILEVADVLVVNKSDREGAKTTVRELQGMIALGRGGRATPGSWRVPVLTTVAVQGTGVAELVDSIEAHDEHLRVSGEDAQRRLNRAEVAIHAVVLEEIQQLLASAAGRAQLAAAAERVADGEVDSHASAVAMLQWMRGSVAARSL